jgi:hypothetical protein
MPSNFFRESVIIGTNSSTLVSGMASGFSEIRADLYPLRMVWTNLSTSAQMKLNGESKSEPPAPNQSQIERILEVNYCHIYSLAEWFGYFIGIEANLQHKRIVE